MDSERPSDLGGIRSLSSSAVIRATRSLSSRFPATIAWPPDLFVPNAPSLVSSRSPALRWRGSGPWQLKHLSDRIGRTWKLKSTLLAGVAPRSAAVAAKHHAPHARAAHAIVTGPLNRQRRRNAVILLSSTPVCDLRPISIVSGDRSA